MKPIKLAVFDFDGVFTDDHVYVDQIGREMIMCSKFDGYGIEILRKAGVTVCVLTKERHPSVVRRCEKLKIPCIQVLDNKIAWLKLEVERLGLSPDEISYMGNDIPDIECLEYVGLAACPCNAHPKVKAVCDLITQNSGGNGAVRELCDMILDRNMTE